MANTKQEIVEVFSQQVLLPDGSVFSRQWLSLAGEVTACITPHKLLTRYLSHIRRATFALIRPATSDQGTEFRLLDSTMSLLSFSPPEVQSDARCCSISLCLSGGILVQAGECDKGKFCLSAEKAGTEITVAVQLSDYCPLLLGNRRPSRLRKVFYRLTQAYIHKVVTVRYLARLHRDLTGKKLPLKVTMLVSSEGERI